jgi:hypothetical protein
MDYYGAYKHQQNRADEAAASQQRLKVQLMDYQNIILNQSQVIAQLTAGVCPSAHTTTIYQLQPIIEPDYEEV